MDMTKLIVAFHNFAIVPEKNPEMMERENRNFPYLYILEVNLGLWINESNFRLLNSCYVITLFYIKEKH